MTDNERNEMYRGIVETLKTTDEQLNAYLGTDYTLSTSELDARVSCVVTKGEEAFSHSMTVYSVIPDLELGQAILSGIINQIQTFIQANP